MGMCALFCENGFQQDANGCDTCVCNAPPTNECPEVMCALFCEFGMPVDEQGCTVCTCIDPCQDVDCQGGTCVAGECRPETVTRSCDACQAPAPCADGFVSSASPPCEGDCSCHCPTFTCIDPCEDIVCDESGGKCSNGQCQCNAGWEGAECNVPSIQKVCEPCQPTIAACDEGLDFMVTEEE